MTKTWKLVIPAAMALMVGACTADLPPSNMISPVAATGGSTGGAPGTVVSPSTPAAITSGLTNTQVQSRPAQLRRSPARRATPSTTPAPTTGNFGGTTRAPIGQAPSGVGSGG